MTDITEYLTPHFLEWGCSLHTHQQVKSRKCEEDK